MNCFYIFTFLPDTAQVYYTYMYVCRWYHEEITRKEAEALLTPKKDGLFLIRASINFPGKFVLSLW